MVVQATPGSPGPVGNDCNNGNACSWDQARGYCNNLTVGESGQKGWRLLYIQELAALVDTNSKSCTNDNLCLPDGHPFKDVQSSAGYWSASTLVPVPAIAWGVFFSDGDVGVLTKDVPHLAWCGRGASVADAY
jgi:hypothetical protein